MPGAKGYTSIFTPQSQITAAHNSVNASLANEQQQLKQQPKPTQQYLDSIGSVQEAQNALKSKFITQPQFLAKFAQLSPVPGGTNKYSAGNIAGAVGGAVKTVARQTAQAPARAVGELEASALNKTLTPNKVGKVLMGNTPVKPLQQQGEETAASHPGGFHIKGTPITLTPAETGVGLAAGKGALDIAQTIGLAKAPVSAVSKFNATTNAAKTTAKNVAVQNLLKGSAEIPKESPLPSSAKVKPSVTPAETQVKPGQGSALGNTETPTTSRPVGEPTKVVSAAPNEEGAIAPNKIVSDVKDLISKSQQTKLNGSNLSDKLFNLKTNSTADINLATKILKDTKSATPKDWEAAYHYRENPSSPVTSFQKSLHDTVIKPLYDAVSREGESGNYQHRINIDKRGPIQSLLKGDTTNIRGSLLRKTTDADKQRTMKILTDEQGNRTVVSIKTPKDKLGLATGPKQVTAFENNKPTDLGTFKPKTNEDLLNKELKPLQNQQDRLNLEKNTLTATKGRTAASPKRLDNIEKSLQVNSRKIAEVLNKHDVNELNDKTFTDKNGKKYTLGEATTKEIEQHTNIKYSHDARLNAITHFVQSRAAQRANEFIDHWKQDPSFDQIAKKADANDIPEHYIATTAPQFRGYYFEPRIAHILDDFAGQLGKDPLQAVTNINKFLTTTIFMNPIVHLPNESLFALFNRGLSGNIPGLGLGRGIKTSARALTSVIKNDSLWEDLQRARTPTMSRGTEDFSYTMNKIIAKQLKDPNIEMRLVKAGINSPKKLADVWMHNVHKLTWILQDSINAQAVLEGEAKGLTRAEAIKKSFSTGTGAIPDYRAPSALLGSRKLKTVGFDPNISVFSSYHYGGIKSIMNQGKLLIAKDSTIKDRATAADRLAMLAILGVVILPQVDKLARKITGNDNSEVRRAGPLTIPYAVYEATKGKKTAGQVSQDVVTPPPGTKTVLELKNNKDAFGNQIYKPGELKSNPKQFFTDVGRHAAGAVSPVSIGQRASKNPSKTLGSILGISTPASATQNKVYNLLGQQLGSSGMSVDTQRTNELKTKARQQIASGKGNSLAKDLVKQGVISSDSKLKEFEKTAKWTPVQRAFSSLSPTNKLEVLRTAKPGELKQLIMDKQSLLISLSNTAQSKTAKPATKQAAQQLIKKLGGDQGSLYSQYKSQQHQKRIMSNFSRRKSGFSQP